MKKRILSLAKHPIAGGSSLIFLGTLGANIINYIFNISMGNFLSVQDYGLLTALTALLILVGIFSVSFVNIVTKFSAKYYGLGNEEGSLALVHFAWKSILGFSAILTLILILLIPFLSSFFHIDNYFYIFLVILSIFFSLIISLPTGFIQGRLQFLFLTIVTLIQPALRLIFAFVLILWGFGIVGPLVGLVLSISIPAIGLIIYLLRKYRKPEVSSFDHMSFRKEFYHYTYTSFLAGIGITLLSNTDIILVRHFFHAEQAGQYAALSLMGKAIFYFSTPINTVFFPLIAVKREKKEKLRTIVLLALGVVGFISLGFCLIYFVFPNLILKVFFPKPGYAVLANYLGFYSLYIFVFSLASLLHSYFFSIGRTGVFKISLFAAGIQALLIFFFHKSLFEVIAGLFITSVIMLLLLIIYYFKHGEN